MATGELVNLIQQEIPEGRQSLQDSFANLQRVAQYCEGNYVQATDKRRALEETKNYTTHSLASVAYQINSLATNFLKLLDLQQNQLAEMESSVNHLSQIVMIHKEKVARREIGVLTTNRNAARPMGVKAGIIFPEQAERPIKYTRKAIDYSQLDEVGHGVKVQSAAPQATRQGRSPSLSSTGSSQAPTTKPPTPPVGRTEYGTIGRNAGAQYRSMAPPVVPPSLPMQYAPSYVMGKPQNPGKLERGYAPTQDVMGHRHSPGGPLVGMARPMSQSAGPPASPSMIQSAPPPRLSESDSPLPPPPPEVADSLQEEATAPLPPPPAMMLNHPPAAPPPPPNFGDHSDSDSLPRQDDDPYAATGPQFMTQSNWKPQSYLEKVVAIYDYEADKEDELSFQENAVVYVIKKNDDGWWEGVMDGVTGLFPSNYVEPCI